MAESLKFGCGKAFSDQNSDKLNRNIQHGSIGAMAIRGYSDISTTACVRRQPTFKETRMKKTLATLLAAATIAVTMAATATDAAAWRGRGWGGPGLALGILGGAVIAGAIIASRPRGYVVYEGYGQPVQGPGCYWASQPVYGPGGRIVGYTGQPVQVCPGY
jgi:hypothetical protein